MISVQEATDIILTTAISRPDETVPLTEATGRVLREALTADRDFPPFDRVTMDGIAINYQAFAEGRRRFRIESIGPAGAPQTFLKDTTQCIEIMTGAVLPENADTVIRYEDLTISDGVAQLGVDQITKGQNVHKRAFDRAAKEIIVAPGCRISGAEIGVAATVGKAHLKVASLPKAIVLSTGDELVAVSEQPLPHQIRRSNSYSVHAALKQWGLPADIDHLRDDKDYLLSRLSEILSNYQLIVMSGGVSKGKFDYLPEVLEELGCNILFHRVSQRPGKPFWFGQTDEGACIFALPGNPVSTFMCAYRYLIPWLNKSVGLPPFSDHFAALQEDFSFKPALTYFLQVKAKYSASAVLQAYPVAGGGSGDLANLPLADGFLELPADQPVFKKGECFPYIPYR